VYTHSSEWADEKLSKHFNEERSDFSATYLSALELEGPYDDALIQLFDEHDLVNMHWVSGLFSIKCLQYLSEAKKPVLVTMHDQKHLTGACHYSAGCRLFTTLCSACPQLATRRAQLLAEQQHRIKQSILSNPNFYWTGPSEWILKEAVSSGIPHSTGHVLPSLKNPVVDDSACTTDELKAISTRFNPQRKRVALVADNLNDPRKGSLIGVRALAMAVAGGQRFNELIELHLAGATEGTETIIRDMLDQFSLSSELQPQIVVVSHGRVPSHHLAVILSLVDLLIFPSIEENYSNLLIETLGQGTAVAAFAVGGNREIARSYPELMRVVGDRLNISNGFNAHDETRLSHATMLLSRAIRQLLIEVAAPSERTIVAKRCREIHSRDRVAESYFSAMQSLLDRTSSLCADNYARGGVGVRRHQQQPSPYIAGNRRRVVNNNEPVFWIGTKNDWPMQVADNQLLLMLVLQPSWDDSYISSRLDSEHWIWNQFIAFKHDQYEVPELQYWDMAAVIGICRDQGNGCSARLLLPTAELENALPVLLQATVSSPTEKEITWNTLSDLLWQAICGDCLVSPMQGLSHFPSTSHLVEGIKVKSRMPEKPALRQGLLLSEIDHCKVNVEEPVFWLGRYTFNDIALKPEQSFIGSGLYPSWEPSYLQKIISSHVMLEVLQEVNHAESALRELRYWNTVLFRISSSSAGQLFTEISDEIHAFPILYLGYGLKSEIPAAVGISELASIAKGLDAVIPPMAGLHQIVSSLC
jgi:hypothetical protein